MIDPNHKPTYIPIAKHLREVGLEVLWINSLPPFRLGSFFPGVPANERRIQG